MSYLDNLRDYVPADFADEADAIERRSYTFANLEAEADVVMRKLGPEGGVEVLAILQDCRDGKLSVHDARVKIYKLVD